MRFMTIFLFLMVFFLALTGCSTKRVLVPFDQVEKNNDVALELKTGQTVSGTVVKREPHRLTLLDKGRLTKPISKTAIHSIKRVPPIYDDFGNPISSLDIQKAKTRKNVMVYGLGGGFLSIGSSFFLGSMLANPSEGGDDAVLAGTVAVGAGLGTALFVRAGAARDHRDAIARVKRERQLSVKINKDEMKKTSEDLEKELVNERRKEQELRKERERLLRELQRKQ